MSAPASPPNPKRDRRAVSVDHEQWMGLAADAMRHATPTISLTGHARAPFKRFLARCTPANVFALLRAHASALEAMVDLAAHLEALPCICPFRPDPSTPEGAAAVAFAKGAGEAHLAVCPKFLRGHAAFQRFDATALEGPLPRELTIAPRASETPSLPLAP